MRRGAENESRPALLTKSRRQREAAVTAPFGTVPRSSVSGSICRTVEPEKLVAVSCNWSIPFKVIENLSWATACGEQVQPMQRIFFLTYFFYVCVFVIDHSSFLYEICLYSSVLCDISKDPWPLAGLCPILLSDLSPAKACLHSTDFQVLRYTYNQRKKLLIEKKPQSYIKVGVFTLERNILQYDQRW